MERAVELITRREALRRAAYLLGGAVSASTVAGVLAGCERKAGTTAAAWRPRTLSPDQSEMVLVIGEHIIPETDTPGARAGRVNEFIDAMLTDFYPTKKRQHFMSGLDRVEARAQRTLGKRFLELSPEQQLELVRALNRTAFQERKKAPEVPPEGVAQPENPVLQEGDVQTGNERALPTVPANDDWDPDDVGPGAFFRTLKELVVVGYYTSEVGATQELAVNPMGAWRADIPYAEVGKSWA